MNGKEQKKILLFTNNNRNNKNMERVEATKKKEQPSRNQVYRNTIRCDYDGEEKVEMIRFPHCGTLILSHHCMCAPRYR